MRSPTAELCGQKCLSCCLCFSVSQQRMFSESSEKNNLAILISPQKVWFAVVFFVSGSLNTFGTQAHPHTYGAKLHTAHTLAAAQLWTHTYACTRAHNDPWTYTHKHTHFSSLEARQGVNLLQRWTHAGIRAPLIPLSSFPFSSILNFLFTLSFNLSLLLPSSRFSSHDLWTANNVMHGLRIIVTRSFPLFTP